jgi:alpha-glucosidase
MYKAIFPLFLFLIVACTTRSEFTVTSPDQSIQVRIHTADDLSYSVMYKDEVLLNPSGMGFVIDNNDTLTDFNVLDISTYSIDSTWEQPWGEQRIIRENFNALTLALQEKEGAKRKLNLEFKVFNDGIGFRYVFPEQGLDTLNILDELTEFAFTGNHSAWSIKAYHRKKYEQLYEKHGINNQDTVHTPLTMKTADGLYISLHEASLVDFTTYNLFSTTENTLKTDLTPWKDGIKVKTNGTFKSSWRTIQVGEKAGDLIESYLILNLNEPNKLGDVSWVHPIKYIGIWWGIHIKNWTFQQGPKLGATTENTLKYIDFAAENGFDEVLVEGWNEGFEARWSRDWGPNQDFTTPNPRFDWLMLQEYAKSRGVTLQAYNETCANTINYLSQIDSAYTLYEQLGYRSVKVGQVNEILVNGEWHTGQYGVNYYQAVVEKAAKHKLCINFHEPVKATGLRRTYPNLLTREGARGQEYNAWGQGRPTGHNPPEHLTILPFTRLLSGPMDFTPGIFRVDIPQRPTEWVPTTLSKQLAIYVVIYSPAQMAADLIENYEGHPAFQFIRDVPVDWETTKVIDAEIADYVITARKDRHSEDWYLGALTDEEARDFTVSLGFLETGTYEAQIYQDSEKTDLETAPMEYEILKREVSSTDSLKLRLANSGGAAIRFKKI